MVFNPGKCLPSLIGTTKILHIAIYHFGKLFLARTHVEVHGKQLVENFQGNAIFAANHASELDPFVACLALDQAGLLRTRLPLIFLSREKAFYNDMGFVKSTLYGGFLFRLLGAHPVTPKNERTSEATRRNTLETHLALLKAGYPVMIFPEGTRTMTGSLLPAKMGVAILSEESGCPIIPLAIDGTFKLSFGDFWHGRKKVRVVFGTPLVLHRHRSTIAVAHHFSKKRGYIRKARVVMHTIEKMLISIRKEK